MHDTHQPTHPTGQQQCKIMPAGMLANPTTQSTRSSICMAMCWAGVPTHAAVCLAAPDHLEQHHSTGLGAACSCGEHGQAPIWPLHHVDPPKQSVRRGQRGQGVGSSVNDTQARTCRAVAEGWFAQTIWPMGKDKNHVSDCGCINDHRPCAQSGHGLQV